MDAVARDKMVSVFTELCLRLPMLRKRRKQVLQLCRKLGRTLRRVGIDKITTAAGGRSIFISWRGYFYESQPPHGHAHYFDADESAVVVETLLRDLESMESKTSTEQTKLDNCWAALNEFFRRMEQLNGQHTDQ